MTTHVRSLLTRLGIKVPIILAPMAGGPGTPQLAAAVTNAGGLGSIGAAYLTPPQIREELDAFALLSRGAVNVNLFAGGRARTIERDPRPILEILAPIHTSLGIGRPQTPEAMEDPFPGQLAAVLAAKPSVFSFTFGIPDSGSLRQLRDAGIVILGTATTVEEAVMLGDAGVDAIVAQGSEAGAHRGTFAVPFEEAMVPTLELVSRITAYSKTPVIASGGIMTGAGIAHALRAGAAAVQLGTAFLASPEAGTSAPYRQALLAGGRPTVVTRAYSGRAARGLGNAFIDLIAERDELILPFPFQNALTRPMRTAAASTGNPEYLSLWAGTGVDRIRPIAAAELMAVLMQELRESAPDWDR